MADSKVSLANGALQKLGAKRIESLDQNHPNARSMNAAYNGVRQAMLRRYTWGFSRRRKSIAADGSRTTWGSHNRYSVPNDFLRLIRDDESGLAVDWQIESAEDGVFIVTDDASPLKIKYVADIDDPNFYDSLFKEAFSTKLALETCEDVTGSTSKKAGLQKDYDDCIAEAKRIGAIEEPAKDFPEDEWLAARR